ncbi:MAG: hypothetical protein WB699_14610 [Bacteroidota bacterium]
MKTISLLLFLSIGLFPARVFAQRPDTLTLDDYQAIYKGLEKRTDMFEKERWTISDQSLISDVLFQLVNFQGEGDRDLNTIRRGSESFIKKNREGLLRIECIKRSHDDEIERLDFYEMGGTGQPLVSLSDYANIREVLGSTTYAKVRTNPTTHFDSRQGIAYDLYFHALNPEIMLWSTSPDSSHCYRVSAFGRLGDDYLDLPFWFKGTIVSGLRLAYVDNTSLLDLDRDYTLYGLSVGVESPINFSVQTQEQQSGNSPFKSRKVEGSGTGFYLKASYTPWSRMNIITQNFQEQIQFVVEGSVALQEKKLYAWSIPDSFYSVRNYVTLAAYLKHVSLFNFGAGITWHDVHHVYHYTPPDEPLRRLGPSTNNVLPFLEVGISEDGSLLQYAITTQLNYSVNENYGFFVVRSMLMLSNTIGIDLRYFKAIRTSGLPVWQYDNYLAISPVFRVNF